MADCFLTRYSGPIDCGNGCAVEDGDGWIDVLDGVSGVMCHFALEGLNGGQSAVEVGKGEGPRDGALNGRIRGVLGG